MKRRMNVVHEFVEFIPVQLEDGKIYISIPFATTVHNCCCGCGNRVVTPLTPFKWKLTYDGQTVSISPSIGNWSFPCRSHYWIERGKVEWCEKWSTEEITAGQERERLASEKYYSQFSEATEDIVSQAEDRPTVITSKASWWSALRRKLWLLVTRRNS